MAPDAAWIDSYERGYGSPSNDQLHILDSPPRSRQAQHNHAPSQPDRRVSIDGFVNEEPTMTEATRTTKAKVRRVLKGKNSERGRKWDHLRSDEPVIVPRYSNTTSKSPWNAFVESSRYGRIPNEDSAIVDIETLNALQPNFNKPVYMPRLDDGAQGRGARTTAFYKKVWNVILRHPLVPLIFRLTVLLTSILALALSARIFEFENGEREGPPSSERTQSIVAIVVDTVAVPYIGYMTWDEYTGKPLGLRPATQKISLVLMDLFFIIFKSASTTLAMEALVYHNAQDLQVRRYSMALAAFQTVSLIAWSMNFTVNVFRLVQKLGGGEESKV